MITSSGKQSDKELETSFVHLMQMPDVHVCHRDIAEFKITLPSSSLAHPRTCSPRAQAFASFFPSQAENSKYLLICDLVPPPNFEHAPQAFFLQVYNCYVNGQGKCNLDKVALWPKPVKDITAVSGNVDQSKLDSQVDPYILCILIKYIHSRRQHKC